MLVKQFLVIAIFSISLSASAQQKKVKSKGSKEGFEISIHTTI